MLPVEVEVRHVQQHFPMGFHPHRSPSQMHVRHEQKEREVIFQRPFTCERRRIVRWNDHVRFEHGARCRLLANRGNVRQLQTDARLIRLRLAIGLPIGLVVNRQHDVPFRRNKFRNPGRPARRCVARNHHGEEHVAHCVVVNCFL